MNKSVFLFAGEQSGDNIGAHLVHLLKNHSFDCLGVGGKKMEAQGLKLVYSMEHFQVMGFIQVLKKLPQILHSFFQVKKSILNLNPAIVIFIDYPGFSLKMAKKLKESGYKGKIVQYVCPSIWAWKKNRKLTLEKYFDLVFTLFSFEKSIFDQSNLKAIWCGHPFALSEEKNVPKTHLIIFPGSRKSTIELNLKYQLEAAETFRKTTLIPIGISCARQSLLKTIQAINTQNYPIFINGEEKELAKFAIATSGTITFELALRGVLAAVTYKVKLLDGLIAKYIFKLKLKCYCIVNIIMQEEIYKEFIGWLPSSQSIYEYLIETSKTEFPKENFKKKVYNPFHDTLFMDGIFDLLKDNPTA